MPFRILPLLLLAAMGVVIAAEVNYPLDAPGPDGRRPGDTLTQSLPAPPIANEENRTSSANATTRISRPPSPTAFAVIRSI